MRVLTLETTIPNSVLPYPGGFFDRAKYVAWRIFAPAHPPIKRTLLRLRIIHHAGRQRYLLGKLAKDRTLAEFLGYLNAIGFGNHFIAWDDDDQIISLRKFDGFERQYHLRIFSDGEIRGHYEYTPECRPLLHIREIGREERRDDFVRFMEDWVTT